MAPNQSKSHDAAKQTAYAVGVGVPVMILAPLVAPAIFVGVAAYACGGLAVLGFKALRKNFASPTPPRPSTSLPPVPVPPRRVV